jgi:hypothetical protein
VRSFQSNKALKKTIRHRQFVIRSENDRGFRPALGKKRVLIDEGNVTEAASQLCYGTDLPPPTMLFRSAAACPFFELDLAARLPGANLPFCKCPFTVLVENGRN